MEGPISTLFFFLLRLLLFLLLLPSSRDSLDWSGMLSVPSMLGAGPARRHRAAGIVIV